MIVRNDLTNEEVAALTYALETVRVDNVPPKFAMQLVELTRVMQEEYGLRGLREQGYGF